MTINPPESKNRPSGNMMFPFNAYFGGKDGVAPLSPVQMFEQVSELQISLWESGLRFWMAPFSLMSRTVYRSPLEAPGKTEPDATPIANATAEKPVSALVAPKAAIPEPVVPVVENVRPAISDVELKPELLMHPDGVADDLQRIIGIGPKLARLLNDEGIWHFRQIASWTPAEVLWVNSKLAFKGRIEREGWQKQAQRLARGVVAPKAA